jgi:hypothetical protein
MHKTTAFERRTSLDADELDQLLVALKDDAARYQVAIRGYTAEKMTTFGSPYLASLEAKIAQVEVLIRRRLTAANHPKPSVGTSAIRLEPGCGQLLHMSGPSLYPRTFWRGVDRRGLDIQVLTTPRFGAHSGPFTERGALHPSIPKRRLNARF